MSRTEVTDEMIAAAQGGDGDAMWAILSAYEGVMKAAIRSEARDAKPEEAEDLLQDARAILIQHVRDFDSSSSAATLSTYAHRAIRHGVAIAWISMSSALTVEPYAVVDVKHALWQTDGDVEGAWMIVGSTSNPHRRMSRETFVAILDVLRGADSLEAPAANDGDGATLGDTIPDPDSDFTDPTVRRDLARFLLREIPQRQAFALRAYHGVGMTKMDDHEAALGMQIKPGALRRLRQAGHVSARKVAGAHGLAA